MPILTEESPTHHILKLNGDFDVELANEARSVFSQLVENATKDVCVDLSNVDFIDSSGIGAIVFLYKRLRCNRFDLKLTGLQNQPFELIKLLRIDQIIPTSGANHGDMH